MKALGVWMDGRHVATLEQTRRGLSLAYTPEAQAEHEVNTPLLSVSLPVGPRALPAAATHTFLEGLLPEGEARRMLAYDLRVDVADTFGLLAELGRDCAGALTFLPLGEAPPPPGERPPVELLALLRNRLGALADVTPL